MIVAYIYNRTGETQLAQIFQISNFECNDKLSDVSEASFELLVRNKDGSRNENINTTTLQEMNIIRIYHLNHTVEELFFEGFISSVEAGWDSVKVYALSLLGILDYRIIKNAKNFNGTTVKQMLEVLWSEMSPTGLTLDCTITDTITKTYEIGRSMLDILRDITTGGYEFRIIGNVVSVKKNVGSDRTTVVYRKEWQSPMEWNIADARSEYHATNTHNYILTKIGSSPPYSVQDNASMSKYGIKEKYITVNGDNTVTPSGYLADHKDSSREISITPMDKNYTHIRAGDFVMIYIDAGNDIMNFSGVVKVLEKSFLQKDLPEITIKVSTSRIRSMTVFDKMKSLDTRISTLETK